MLHFDSREADGLLAISYGLWVIGLPGMNIGRDASGLLRIPRSTPGIGRQILITFSILEEEE